MDPWSMIGQGIAGGMQQGMQRGMQGQMSPEQQLFQLRKRMGMQPDMMGMGGVGVGLNGAMSPGVGVGLNGGMNTGIVPPGMGGNPLAQLADRSRNWFMNRI